MFNPKEFWLEILQEVYPMFDRAFFITYFKDSAILSYDNKTLIVGFPRPMFLNWHLEHSKDKIFDIVKKKNPDFEELIFKLDGTLEASDRVIDILSHFPSKKVRKVKNKQEIHLPNGITSKIINSKFTLSNFIVGETTKMAHAIAMAVSAHPGERYNPFFLYGDTGLGKTHLLQAIGNEIINNNPESIVVYTTSEEFTNEVVESIQKGNMEKLRKKYRQIDVLIMDDIQFLANKERTMEEFFHTYNALYEASKQIIIASDRPPNEFKGMEDRLVSRFKSGMTADIKMPDYETRLAILYSKAVNFTSLISGDILEFIALNVNTSIRELEGVLMQVLAIIELQRRDPTLKDVGDFIKSINKDKPLIGYEESKPVLVKSIDDVITYTAEYFNLTISDIKGNKRSKELVYPRQLAMYISRENLYQGLAKIGEGFGGRDHTSVLHSLKKIEESIKKDPIVKKDVEALYKMMGIL